jgi:hypothetical protein
MRDTEAKAEVTEARVNKSVNASAKRARIGHLNREMTDVIVHSP